MKRESAEDNRIANPISAPHFMSLKEAAAHLGLSVWVLRQAVLRGEIAYVQFSPQGKVWIEAHDLAGFGALVCKTYRQIMR